VDDEFPLRLLLIELDRSLCHDIEAADAAVHLITIATA
jgi:hypothetical protein